uniref:RNase H type-1 domain-containing protein n=1 Tax=Manihot esculenta TaxID=3983 RepID=A0A2C9WFH6_MANES
MFHSFFASIDYEILAQAAIDLLQGAGVASNTVFLDLLSQFRDLCHWSWEVRITQYYREANQVADKLVNLIVTSSPELQILEAPISEVMDLLRWELQGYHYPGLCLIDSAVSSFGYDTLYYN